MEGPPFLHQPLLFRVFPLSIKIFGTHPPQVTEFLKGPTLPRFNNVGGGEWGVGFQLCGLKAKNIKLHQMNFFPDKQLIKFSCTYWPLSFCKILKKFLGLIQSYEDVPFLGPKWPICPEQFFLVETIIITFIYLLALFIVQNLTKFLQRIQSYEDAQFLGPKWPISPNDNFFQKTC